jgi:hypothetical protein
MEHFWNLQEDRRRALRQDVTQHPVTIEHLQYGKHLGVIIDVSRLGLRLQSTFCFPSGCDLLIHPPTGYEIGAIQGRVVRQDILIQRGIALYEYGIQFIPETDELRHRWFLSFRPAA